MSCNPKDIRIENNRKKMDELWDEWIKYDSINDRHTYSYGFDAEKSWNNMSNFVEQRLKLPFDPETNFTEQRLNRAKLEIKSYAKALKSKFSNFVFMVPEGISKQDPVARKFYLKLNNILEYERVNLNRTTTENTNIANHLLDAYALQTGSKKGGNKALSRLRKIRQEMGDNPNDETKERYHAEINSFVESDQGQIVSQYIDLIHKSTINPFNKNTNTKGLSEFEIAVRKGFIGKDNVPTEYNPSVVKAVKNSQKLLNEMGQVYVNGLGTLKQLIALKYTNSKDVKKAKMMSNQAKYYIENIEEGIKNIEKGRKRGGYFPQISLETIIDVKEKLGKMMNANRNNNSLDSTTSDLVKNILTGIDNSLIPDQAKKRNPNLQKYWEKDPLLVLKEYSEQATQFNKLVNTQAEYLDAMRFIPKSDDEFVSGMKRFIDEEYAIFTQGTTGRPEWANNAATFFNAFQTASKMGLNITGGIKNLASAVHFYSRIGFDTIGKAKEVMETNTDGIADIIRAKEKEAGFLFSDVSKELYSEGLITRNQYNSKTVTFDPITGKIKIEGESLRDKAMKSASWGIDKLLFFHRQTENLQRRWMFRSAFYKKYTQLTRMGMEPKKAEKFSSQFALEMVNGWAYEYARHAKSKAVRGEWRTIEEMGDMRISQRLKGAVGAGSEVTFHLLHYPLSLIESQYDTLKGGYKALLSKQYDAGELRYLSRYAGVMSLVGLTSALFNSNLFNIFEYDLYERVKRSVDSVTKVDDPDQATFGVLSQFTGPTIGTMKYLANMANIIDMDNNELNKILFGNIDFTEEGNQDVERYEAYQLSTFWGIAKNKILPSIQTGRGRDLIMHFLKLYPSQETKKANQAIFGKPKGKASKINDNLDASLALIRSMSV